jgi:A/G-specific adenine glycosylase
MPVLLPAAAVKADPAWPDQSGAADLSARLLRWYDGNRRSMPWRAPAGLRSDPYVVWLSEIMLQQTTVATVGPYFTRFLARWPTITALAGAPLEEVLREWAGLGYYARARNLHRCAVAVAGQWGGQFPAEEADLLDLPGIGSYTAAAIAAIAFDRPAAAVDGNVERVLSRLLALETPLPAAKPAIRAAARRLVPDQRAGDHTQALFDLGATVCVPARPRCPLCPWQDDCRARTLGIAETLPRKAARQAQPSRHGVAFLIRDAQGQVLLRRRPPKGLLGGMLEIPSTDWADTPPDLSDPEVLARSAALPLSVSGWTALPGIVRHTFTHFHLHIRVQTGQVTDAVQGSDGSVIWLAPDRLSTAGLPTVMSKILSHGLGTGSDTRLL